jgi:ethanolamine utilization cobalamin adenosyltransferase
LKIITELELRELFKQQPFDSYRIEGHFKLTPAATEFLNERKIMILDETGQPALGSQHRRMFAEISGPGACGVKTCGDGDAKPEQSTHLKAGVLVLKTHKRIQFRGKLDSIQANLISLIIDIKKSGEIEIAEELKALLAYFRKMMRADVLDEPLAFLDFNGWNDAEIRERSHHPKKYYGIGHFTPDPDQGPVMAGLNQMRSQIRELEIAGVEAFLIDEATCIERQDIILALNRLSSVVYIMMCQYLGGTYGQDTAGK